MLYYDYILTLPREIDHFWKGARPSIASALFVLNRYLGLLGPIPVLFEYFVPDLSGYVSILNSTGPSKYSQPSLEVRELHLLPVTSMPRTTV